MPTAKRLLHGWHCESPALCPAPPLIPSSPGRQGKMGPLPQGTHESRATATSSKWVSPLLRNCCAGFVIFYLSISGRVRERKNNQNIYTFAFPPLSVHLAVQKKNISCSQKHAWKKNKRAGRGSHS